MDAEDCKRTNLQRTYSRTLAWTGAAALAATAVAGCAKQGDAPDTRAYEYTEEEDDESVVDVITQGLASDEYVLPAAFALPTSSFVCGTGSTPSSLKGTPCTEANKATTCGSADAVCGPDAYVGLQKILEGDVMTCGFPYAAWIDPFVGPILSGSFTHGRQQDRKLDAATTSLTLDSFGVAPAVNNAIKTYTRPGDRGIQDGLKWAFGALPYNITRFDSIDNPPSAGGSIWNGADVVNMNCLTCHAGYVPSLVDGSVTPRLTIGVGDVARDFTQGFWFGLDDIRFGLPGPIIMALAPINLHQVDKMVRNLLVWGSELNMNTVGINVANQLGMFLAKHHETDLSFQSDIINPSYYYYDTNPATNDRVPDSAAKLAVDPAPWWRVRKKSALFYNGSTRGFHHGSMALASSICVENAATANYVTGQFPDIQAFVESRPAPKYPWAIDTAKANAGRTLFNSATWGCAGCHGTYATTGADATSPRDPASDTFPNKLIREGFIGTDPAWGRAGWYGNMEVMNKGVNSTAYANVTALTPWIGKGLTSWINDSDQYVCIGGTNPGANCTSFGMPNAFACFFGTCVNNDEACIGGSTPGQACSSSLNCGGGGTCAEHLKGHFASDTCTSNCSASVKTNRVYTSTRAPLDNLGDNPATTSTVEGTKESVPFPGYVAAPLDGIWASAPYFHNGSVPTLMGVLKSNSTDNSVRPTQWKRACNIAGVADSNRQACAMAYDQTRVGWQITVTGAQGSDKTIYDTTKWSQGKGGHTYADSMSDTDRANLLEYLKTL